MSIENPEPNDEIEMLTQLRSVGDALADALSPVLDIEARLARITGATIAAPDAGHAHDKYLAETGLGAVVREPLPRNARAERATEQAAPRRVGSSPRCC